MNTVGFFAEGVDYQLPHPAIDDAILVIAHDAICSALSLLRGSDFSLGTAHEDQITQQLHWILEDRLRQTGEIPGFDERVFRKVWRAPEVTNFDGNHPAKKPDLVFELVRDNTLVLSSQDALFVECKLVGNTHPVTTAYCNDGLSRFIDGDYAWAMQEGMMLGYVRHSYSLSANLSPVLAREPYYSRLGQPSPLQEMPGGGSTPLAEALHITIHNRAFHWPHARGPAHPIRIVHSWHDCS